jgi:hypothetical protein
MGAGVPVIGQAIGGTIIGGVAALAKAIAR